MTGMVMVTRVGGCAGKSSKSAVDEELDKQEDSHEQNQLSLLDFILSALRKSMVSTCRVDREDQDVISAVHHMEIGWPTNVQHITHVTFDRFHGFLGLPVEFEVEVPCRAPSASVSVFGVSADSMQCSCDTRGNSVPTILFDQSLVSRAPSGVLDGLSPEQVLQCNTEEDSVDLIKQLKPTENALLSWAVNLMADVVEQEESNKMHARNIAMVFAPNMTQTNEEEYDSQHEMDTSCESTGPASDDDEQDLDDGQYSPCSKDKDEVESLSDIEECFLRQLGENEREKMGFVSNSRESCAGRIRIGSSFISTSDGEDSRMSSVAPSGLNMDKESHVVCKHALNSNLDMVDNMVES
ncbi:hypothetical protein DH2020_001638 [Rehmannia glutinosa]|uniref:CRIB domain-containing protein n=1 Tax=Rehmannia glutinosa TaxID=99300 RepID=A0ABR0Y0S4_REHGL